MPSVPATAAATSTRPKPPVKSTTQRLTRLRAAKEGAASSPVPTTTTPRVPSGPSGLLARGKERLRTVSDKIVQREQPAIKPKVALDGSSYSETLQAFLRIRPPPGDADELQGRPYLEPQGDQNVLMQAPIVRPSPLGQDPDAASIQDPNRPNIPKPPHIYSFDRVFSPNTSQAQFFTQTTLPLVEKVLNGENGLVFAYGVSNSGKTYTIQGGQSPSPEERGSLPRAIDVVFNSIAGLESKAKLKCSGLADVVLSDEPEERFGIFDDFPEIRNDRIDEDTIKVDRNYSYAVFVSYAEVYNEKIFDLLDSLVPLPAASSSRPKAKNSLAPSRPSALPSHSFALSGAFGSSMSLAALANGGGGVLRRKPLALKNDPEGCGKYIAGLNEIRVKTREEAQAVFRSGQRARQVFGTLANRESSRSHGIFTLKVVRIHNGAPEDPDSAQVARLAIVDLAGSERTKNTLNTGDRLREAGNINKSLMVLGQCLEVLRSNQQKMAAPPVAGMRKKVSVVPFRHSKLTEIFQSFFVGDGRAVMIVHVNPYDTGFDENSHVMRFSAIAREIQTTASNKVGFPLLKKQISTHFGNLKNAVSGPTKIKVMVPVLETAEQTKVDGRGKEKKAERESSGFVMVEEEMEVIEDDEDPEEDDEKDLLVEHLFEQLRELKTRLYESEMRNASIEVEVREEVAREMSETLHKAQGDYEKRFHDQVHSHMWWRVLANDDCMKMMASDLKIDRKLDILSRTMTPGGSRLARAREESPEDSSFESGIDESLMASQDDSMEIEYRSDPFLSVPPPAATVNPIMFRTTEKSAMESEDDMENSTIEISSGEEDEEDEDEEEEGLSDDSDPEGAAIDDSEDEDVVIGDGEEGEDNEDDEEEEEEEEESEDSSFAASDEPSDESIVEESPQPVSRRQSKQVSPVKKGPTPIGKGKANKKAFSRISIESRTSSSGIDSPSPLKERLLPNKAEDVESGNETETPVKVKKKRTLGKKIVIEDDIEDDALATGKEIRRMVKGGK
ncbi:kinesin family member 20, partial [Tremellales sp. Uapishka_1]